MLLLDSGSDVVEGLNAVVMKTKSDFSQLGKPQSREGRPAYFESFLASSKNLMELFTYYLINVE